ncbi:MAG: sulfatase-like hydrolase/transferase [Polyangiaceae bacterium]|nr:sulfatase-like hydrolase/transferase [Polyangiaceae bacterium]
MSRWIQWAAALVVAAGCGDSKPQGTPAPGASGSNAPGYGDGPVADRVIFSIYDSITSCDVEHRGLLFDLGTESMKGRVISRGDEAKPLETVEHHGATWTVASNRSMEITFTLPEPARLFVSANVQPVAAKNISFFVDDQGLGGARLKGDDPRIVSTEPTELPFDAGEHTLMVRFAPARVRDAYAHIDWIRVGIPDEIKATYGPPTVGDVLQPEAALGRVPHRALRLKTPSVLRCPFRVPPGARFRTALGVLGGTEGTAEISVRVDGSPPTKILEKALVGGEDAAWQDVDVSLDPFEGKLVQLELRATGKVGPGRVLFGDPEVLVSTASPENTRPARVVVLVVMSGVDTNELPGYAERPPPHLERLTKLADQSALFRKHRASTNVVTGNVASLVTGLPPEVHGVIDYGTALPSSVQTLLRKATDAAVQVGFFTAVPHTFEPASLARGMKIVEVSPIEGEQREVMAEATKWLQGTLAASPTTKVFLIVHAQGGHPPWHVPSKTLDVLPPENYTGDIQPRRAGQQLAMLRRKGAKADLSEQDMIRLGAFYELALGDQDAAIGGILDALDAAEVADQSLVIVTTDQSSGLSTLFADAPAFDERALHLPLYVRFPGGKLAGRRVDDPSGVEDVAQTISTALGLPDPKTVWGRDLSHVASGFALPSDGPRFALFADAYSVRWDSLVFKERRQSKGFLCDLNFDPTCSFDRRAELPFAASAMARALAVYEESIAQGKHDRVPLVLDDETLAALRVWGAME